jgi:hypothetical protein
MPADATQVTRLKWLFRCSAAAHLGLGIACLVLGLKTPTSAPQLYSFYRTRIAGERSYTQASNASNVSSANVSSANVSSVTSSNASSFLQDLQLAYAKACPLKTAPPRPLLILGASMDSKLGLRDVNQTWMPERHAFFGMAEVNGYLMLAIVLFISFLFQLSFLYFCFQDNPLKQFRQPCIWRWLEYALTSPLQVVLIASCVLIRDVYTVTLLLAAQLVCVLLGFAVEAANAGIEEIEETKDTTVRAIDFPDTEIATQVPLIQETDEQKKARHIATRKNARKSFGLWLACFLAASILHAAIWYIIITQLSNVVHETDCQDSTTDSDADNWKGPVSYVVYGQLILFSLFGLVPLLQEIAFLTRTTPAADVFLYGSIAYAVLSVLAKVVLAGTYIAFVALFPFKTRL